MVVKSSHKYRIVDKHKRTYRQVSPWFNTREEAQQWAVEYNAKHTALKHAAVQGMSKWGMRYSIWLPIKS